MDLSFHFCAISYTWRGYGYKDMDIKNKAPEITILSEIEKLVRLFSFYPEGHEYLKVASARICNVIKQQFGGLNTVNYAVDRRHISLNGTIVEGFDKLSKMLFYKRIKNLTVHNSARPEDLLAFVQTVSHGDLILPRNKSIKQMLFANNVSGVEVEEVDYETIKEELENETEQQAETPEEEVNLENMVQDLTDDEEEAIRLINLIEKEPNPQRYTDLSDELAIIVRRLVDTDRYEIPLIAVRTYTQHVYQQNKTPAITGTARSQVEGLSMEKGMLHQIAAPIVTGNPYYYSLSVKTVRLIGEPAIEELIGSMIGTETMQSLKFIAGALTVFQKLAYPHLKNVILSANYKAAAIAIDVAANIRAGAESTIATGLKHADLRIRKKALQALFELNTSHGNGIIEKLLTESKDQRMIDLVVSMTGKYRRNVFVPGIKRIIPDAALPHSLKHNALLVLGELGSTEAVQTIIDSVFSPSALLPKQYPDIKLTGIKALGSSMNELAIANLIKLLESKEEHIRSTTWNTLYEMGKKINV